MLETEAIKAAGPIGMIFLVGYFFVKEVFGFVRSRSGNGNGSRVTHHLTTQQIYEALVEHKAQFVIQTEQSKEQTRLLKRIVELLSPNPLQ